MRSFVFPLVVAASLLTSPAHAAADSATAAQLEQDLKAMTDALTKEATLLKFEGTAKVTPEGDIYQVALPAVRINLDAGDYARIPALSAQLTPQTDGTYRFNVTLPSPLLSIYDITDIPTHVAELQGQDISGVWDSANQLARTLKMDLRGLTLTQQAKNFVVVSLDRLKVSGENALDPSGKLTSNSLFSLSAVRGYDDKDNEVFNLGGAAISYKVKDANWTRVQQARNAAATNLRGDTVDAASMASLAGRMGGLGGKGALAVVIRDVGTRFVAQGMGSTEVTSAQLGQLDMLFSSAQDEAGQFTGDVHYHHDGLQVTGLPSAVLNLVVPATTKLVARVENVPLESVLSGLESSGVPQSADNPGAIGTTATALQLLDRAKASLVIDKLELTAPLLSLLSQGRFQASERARYGFTGEFNSKLGKLDALIARLGKEASRPATPDQLPDPMAPSLLMGLTMLRGFGETVEGDSTGLRAYNIEVTKSGTINLNGTDIMNLIMGGAMSGMGSGPDTGAGTDKGAESTPAP